MTDSNDIARSFTKMFDFYNLKYTQSQECTAKANYFELVYFRLVLETKP